MTPNRARMIEILASELEVTPGLPPNAASLIADMREGKIGPGFEATLRAMVRVAEEAKL
jgi:hypothetical protein